MIVCHLNPTTSGSYHLKTGVVDMYLAADGGGKTIAKKGGAE